MNRQRRGELLSSSPWILTNYGLYSGEDTGPSKSALKKAAKAAEKEKKAAERAAQQQKAAEQKAESEVVRRLPCDFS